MTTNPERVDMSQDGVERFLAGVKNKVDPSEFETIEQFVNAYHTLTGLIDDKDMSLRRLRQMVFGNTSEKTKDVVDRAKGGGKSGEDDKGPEGDDGNEGDKDNKEHKAKKKKPPPKGHGRNGASALTSAERVHVPNEELKHRDQCPECDDGIVYTQKTPAVLIRFAGQAPIGARVLELERLRCGLCGEVFTAEPPADTSDQKYDASAVAMIALLKYGTGVPFHRLDGLQGALGIPLPSSTQWDLVKSAAGVTEPVFTELIRTGAQGKVVHNDDTGVNILALKKETAAELMEREGLPDDRTGTHTSGIVSIVDGQRIALFLTGRRHAGENLARVLSRRALALPPPIQMCDGLSHNDPKGFATLLANCMAHGRRKFVELIENFPEECQHVLETLREVYRIEAVTVAKKFTDEERLKYHQAHSAPVMDGFWKWCEEQFDKKLVEPNSSLGKAIKYMTVRKEQLTLFLRKAGAPLDNNLCERILKKVIRHRKNSMFFKTRVGAHVGDVFMSLIQTAELAGVDPFHYLTELLKNPEAVAARPAEWLPWNYQQHSNAERSA